MKYEISQQEYVYFLNNLTTTQATANYPIESTSRYAITVSAGVYSTTAPYLTCNFLKMEDLTPFLDWSGLRPMSELEFEKACRGTAAAVANEYAWGTTGIASSAYSISNANSTNEVISANYSTTVGNAHYISTDGAINGPTRVGIFAGTSGNTGRVTSGASYYGIMEMSGNTYERVITLGNSTGRAFTAVHGDGKLNSNGTSDASTWPDYSGTGFRGGSINEIDDQLRVSDRKYGATVLFATAQYNSSRGVRTAP